METKNRVMLDKERVLRPIDKRLTASGAMMNVSQKVQNLRRIEKEKDERRATVYLTSLEKVEKTRKVQKSSGHQPQFMSKATISVIQRPVHLDSDLYIKGELPRYHIKKRFPNGSHWYGEWDTYEITGRGVYDCFTGVRHVGTFQGCLDHGVNTVKFPNGSILGGVFSNGNIIKLDDYQYSNGSLYNIRYCKKPDRRYYNELVYGLNPAGRSYITNEHPKRKIPNGCYDVVDGFYNPITKCVYDYDEPEKVLRIPTKEEHDWILKYCRKSFDEVCGYRPDLYENWFEDKTSSKRRISEMYDFYQNTTRNSMFFDALTPKNRDRDYRMYS